MCTVNPPEINNNTNHCKQHPTAFKKIHPYGLNLADPMAATRLKQEMTNGGSLTTYIFNEAADTCAASPQKQLLLSSNSNNGHNQFFGGYFDGTPKFHQRECSTNGFGPLYTITNCTVRSLEERMYDEPYSGDLLVDSGRSWLCCPGSKNHNVSEEPPAFLGGGLQQTEMDGGTAGTVISTPPPMPYQQVSPTGIREQLQRQLDEQSQRYEEQLIELHSVIAELTRKLHQQRTMAIAEEDEISESCTSVPEDSLTCPLEVSELDVTAGIETDTTKTNLLQEDKHHPSKLTKDDVTLSPQHSDPSSQTDSLKKEICRLRYQLDVATGKLAELGELNNDHDEDENKMRSASGHYAIGSCKPDIRYSNIVPIHRTLASVVVPNHSAKLAERVRLKKSPTETNPLVPQQESNKSNTVLEPLVSTQVAEHIVGDILRQCDDIHEDSEAELYRLHTKLEHARAQNSVLAITLAENKANCDRLALLCGKYESNAIALQLALGLTDRAIEAYDVLLALSETELSLDVNDSASRRNRTAAEIIAKRLLNHLDNNGSSSTSNSFSSCKEENSKSAINFHPWHNHQLVYTSPVTADTGLPPWCAEDEQRLRQHVSQLKVERSQIQGTCVNLESLQMERNPIRTPTACSTQEIRRMDLEMAVLVQELMALREEKTDLIDKQCHLEREKCDFEVRLKRAETEQKVYADAVRTLRCQLSDAERLLYLATQQDQERGDSDAEHAKGVELELMQALAREAHLKIRVQELVATLEQLNNSANTAEQNNHLTPRLDQRSVKSVPLKKHHQHYYHHHQKVRHTNDYHLLSMLSKCRITTDDKDSFNAIQNINNKNNNDVLENGNNDSCDDQVQVVSDLVQHSMA